MTEEEAKKNNCPFAAISAPLNRGGESWFKCDASTCMMWRWISGPKSGLPKAEWNGYCGLAGKP